jgi:acyl-coenzyme A synthetase/AMP-(fatty) acid ligase
MLTKMPPDSAKSLRARLASAGSNADRYFHATRTSVLLTGLLTGSSLNIPITKLFGRSVLVATRDQLPAALALIELDGLARRLVLCPPDVPREYLSHVIANAEIDAIVSDDPMDGLSELSVSLRATISTAIRPVDELPTKRTETDWVMFTSGTAAMPKMVRHTLAGLTGAIKPREGDEPAIIWSTFYDIRRYGGLQIFLRAINDGASLVLSDAAEPTGEFLVRLAARGLTHISGTPSHWRRALMSPQAHAIKPRYARLSGEIADQAILDNLHTAYPDARIVHAYASTEAGVGFEVHDGREGFPASVIEAAGDLVFKIEDGLLRIRSPRAALCYVGADAPALVASDGFVDTGDAVERREDRYYFVGRSDGIINVGGLKVHPEEVEAVINRHPQVRMSQVRARKNPITGSIVVADVVLRENGGSEALSPGKISDEISEYCRGALASYKVPAVIRFVPCIKIADSGKLVRRHA